MKEFFETKNKEQKNRAELGFGVSESAQYKIGGAIVESNFKTRTRGQFIFIILLITFAAFLITGCSKQKVSDMEYNQGRYTGEVIKSNVTIGSKKYTMVPHGNGVLKYDSGMKMDGLWDHGQFISPHRKPSLPIGVVAAAIAIILGGAIAIKVGGFVNLVNIITKILSGGNSLGSGDNSGVDSSGSDSGNNGNEDEENNDSTLQLQLNKSNFVIENGGSGGLKAKALIVDSKGKVTYAADAEIQIICETEGISFESYDGKGTLETTIYASEDVVEGVYNFQVIGTEGEKQVTKYVKVKIVVEELEVKFENGKHTIKPDKGDSVSLYARLKNAAASSEISEEDITKISFDKVGEGSEWLDFSESKELDGWTAIRIEASNPTGERSLGHQPPEKAGIHILATASDGKEIEKVVYVTLIPYPTIELSKNSLSFLNNTEEQLEIEASIKNAEPGEWTCFAEIEEGEKEIANVSVIPKAGGSSIILVQEIGAELEESVHTETMKIKVYATSLEESTDEKTLTVHVSKEGLYISQGLNNEKALKVVADKDNNGNMKVSELDFVFLKWNPQERRLVSDLSISSNVEISEPETEDDKAYSLFNATSLKKEYLRERPSNTPSSVYGFSIRKVVPGENREILSSILYASVEADDNEYEVTIPLKIVLAYLDETKKEWIREYENLKKIINEFLPEPIKTQKLIDVEAKKDKMGATDFRETRNEYWNLAYNAIMAEKRIYDDEAYWADKAVTTLEWTAWIGDRAFASALSTFTGPVGGFFITQFKEAVVDFIVKLEENPTKTAGEVFDEWFWARLQGTVSGGIDGVLTSNASPNSFKWVSMFFVYKVAWHYQFDKDSSGNRKGLIEAIMSAGWDLSATAIEDAIGPWAEAAAKGKGFKIVFV